MFRYSETIWGFLFQITSLINFELSQKLLRAHAWYNQYISLKYIFLRKFKSYDILQKLQASQRFDLQYPFSHAIRWCSFLQPKSFISVFFLIFLFFYNQPFHLSLSPHNAIPCIQTSGLTVHFEWRIWLHSTSFSLSAVHVQCIQKALKTT